MTESISYTPEINNTINELCFNSKERNGGAKETAQTRQCLVLTFIFVLFRATPTACLSSQARGWIGATAAGLHQSQQLGIRAASTIYTTAHGNAGFPTE